MPFAINTKNKYTAVSMKPGYVTE